MDDSRGIIANTFSMPKVDFPEFDGHELEDWLYKCRRYFELEHVPEDRKVKLASLYLYGSALQWHYSYVKNRKKERALVWEEYSAALNSRFGKEVFEDPMGKMKNLKQEGEYSNLYAYMEEFDICLRRALEKIDLPMSFQVSLFINGLKEEFKSTLWLLKPVDLLSVQASVRILSSDVPQNRVGSSNSKPLQVWSRPIVPISEQRMLGEGDKSNNHLGNTLTIPGMNRSGDDRSVTITSASSGVGSNAGFTGRRRLSQEEIEERRSKGLCFVCNESFDRNHKCSKRQVYSMIVEPVEEGLEDSVIEGAKYDREDVRVTLHALKGELQSEGVQTMHITGLFKRQSLNILIDSGSTHNFVDIGLIKGMNLMVEMVSPIKIIVAEACFVGIC
ncbi:hypothetical protein MLD38_020809 [Melastoma candidum]|uniref:Uncharacterized protein n=1 Tax=Melastoma candidum TaxID=119954 RepID=A0ACB9QEE4_9MYRT|nr:hypothetical protein MLD38_020809 [Melastoma candidum]